MDDEGTVRDCLPAQARDHGVSQLNWKALCFTALKAGMEEKGKASFQSKSKECETGQLGGELQSCSLMGLAAMYDYFFFTEPFSFFSEERCFRTFSSFFPKFSYTVDSSFCLEGFRETLGCTFLTAGG